MNLLFIADVVGSPGRDAVRALLPRLRERHDVHLVVCNCENSAAGYGVTRDTARDLFDAGVDVLTGGNHLWDKRESVDYLAEEPRLVRPANLPPGTPGEGWRTFRARDGSAVGVVNLLGRVFMKEADDPFRASDAAVEALRGAGVRTILVDFHAETTAEKVALGWHLDGRVSAVLGTHTHVQTADERILEGGTACLSDAGMTGGFESVIGMDRHAALRRFTRGLPERLQPATGDVRLNGVLLTIDPATGRTSAIRRLQVPLASAADTGGARLLGGEEPALAVRLACRARVATLVDAGVQPVLALVSVGEDPASQIYLKRKGEACAEAGIESRRIQLPAGTDTRTVVQKVQTLGADPDVHGILVQLPLAAPADAQAVLEAVPPAKDVDGFHPENAGRLASGLPCFVPCTPRGVFELLRHYEIPLAGRRAVVLGRSNIVGRPMANLLSGKDANMTVTIGHSASGPALRELAREADLLVCAIGRPESIDASWVKPGAVVVDVGIHRVADATRRTGSRITGDVDAASVRPVAGALTPVPGGVGPMTVAMVVANTVLAAERLAAGAMR